MALSIGFRIFSFLPSCYSSYGALKLLPRWDLHPLFMPAFAGRTHIRTDPATLPRTPLVGECLWLQPPAKFLLQNFHADCRHAMAFSFRSESSFGHPARSGGRYG